MEEDIFKNQYDALMELDAAGRADNQELDPPNVADVEVINYGNC